MESGLLWAQITHPTASLQQEGTVQCTYNAPASALHFYSPRYTQTHTLMPTPY